MDYGFRQWNVYFRTLPYFLARGGGYLAPTVVYYDLALCSRTLQHASAGYFRIHPCFKPNRKLIHLTMHIQPRLYCSHSPIAVCIVRPDIEGPDIVVLQMSDYHSIQ